MSKQNIWNKLRAAGLSEAGTAGLMGNMWAESTLKSNIVEKRCKMSDEDYTAGVDNGTIDFLDSVTAYGYGLCQWTYRPRKAALLAHAKNLGVSIGDENMQIEFCIKEITQDYSSLLELLKTTTDLYTAVNNVCVDYERPAVNNIADRYTYALRILEEFRGTAVEETVTTKETAVNMPVLSKGDKGVAVGMVQFALAKRGYDLGKYGSFKDGIDCDFGTKTEKALKDFCGATEVTARVWRLLI